MNNVVTIIDVIFRYMCKNKQKFQYFSHICENALESVLVFLSTKSSHFNCTGLAPELQNQKR